MTGKVKQYCTACGDEKNLTDFYSSSSPFHAKNGKLHVCKQCIWDFIGQSKNNMNLIKSTLRMIDKPFLVDLWESSVEEALNRKQDTFKTFMKNLGMRQNRDLNWSDSILSNSNSTSESTNDFQEEDFEVTSDMITYWGRGYENWEYHFLEEERYKIMSSFECPDYGMEMIMKDICFINLDIEKTRQEKKDNSAKAITNLIKTRSDLMNDANMKPIQATGAESNDQITFGTLIKKWENERPVPKPLDDEMKEYIDTYMVGHLAKMEGLNNELTEKYDEALSKYTINFEDINRDQEEFDD